MQPHNRGEAGGVMTEKEQMRFKRLLEKGKQLTGDGYIGDALKYYKKALTIAHSEKLKKRIAKMEVRIHDKNG